MAGVTGLEPATSGVTGRRSNQLSYTPSSLGHVHWLYECPDLVNSFLSKKHRLAPKNLTRTCEITPRNPLHQRECLYFY